MMRGKSCTKGVIRGEDSWLRGEDGLWLGSRHGQGQGQGQDRIKIRIKIKIEIKSRIRINCKSGGQECPPHIGYLILRSM